MADLFHIPDEAVTHDPCCSSHNVPMTCERYRNTHFVQVRPCCSVDSKRLDDEIGLTDEAWIDVVAAVGWDESNKLWPVLRTALAAALPVLNTARDAETAERLAKIWPDPFGHWTAEEAEAARAMKRALLSHLPPPDRDAESAELASLRVEVAELRRRDAEYAASLRGEPGE